MSKRRSDESRILEFFRTQPIAVAESIFSLVKEEMKKRTKTKELPSFPRPKTVMDRVPAGTHKAGQEIGIQAEPKFEAKL